MTELDTRLDKALKADTPPALDPMFRIRVLERREQAAVRRRLVAGSVLAFGVAILAALATGVLQALPARGAAGSGDGGRRPADGAAGRALSGRQGGPQRPRGAGVLDAENPAPRAPLALRGVPATARQRPCPAPPGQ